MWKSMPVLVAALLAVLGCSHVKGSDVPAAKNEAKEVAVKGEATPLPSGWTAVTTSGFTVAMPGAPKENEDSVDTNAGRMRTHTFEVENGSAYYLSLWSDIPIDPASLNTDAALEGARDNAVLSAGGSLLGDRAMTVEGHPARDFSFSAAGEAGEQLAGHARVVIVGKRQLVFLAMTSVEDPRDGDVQRFLDSVALR